MIKTYLEVHGVNIDVKSEKNITEEVDFYFNELLSDNVLELLQPLAKVTY